MSYTALPQLDKATLSAITECFRQGPGIIDYGVPAEPLFSARNVIPALMSIVFEIQTYPDRSREELYFCDDCAKDCREEYCSCEDCGYPVIYDQFRLAHEFSLSRLGYITATAIEVGDSAFPAHLDHAINYFGNPKNRQRLAIAQATSSFACITEDRTLEAIKRTAEEILGKKIESRTIADALDALRIPYVKRLRRRPKKGE